tara:strand:+ start:1492 stop:1929 length:438 start_codon:yes stop_codon:yes gene_type:complete
MKKKYRLGYTSGVFDLFHIGHLNIIKKAKEKCEKLIVAVSTDELVQKYKNKSPVINYCERKSIVEAIKYVDIVVPQENRNKIEAFKKYGFDVIFVGSDWKGSNVFNEVAEYMNDNGKGCVEYIPYTDNTSSTMLKNVLLSIYKEK